MKCRIWIFIDYPPEWGTEGLWACPLHIIVEEKDVMDRLKSIYELGHTAEVEYMEEENGKGSKVAGQEKGDKS